MADNTLAHFDADHEDRRKFPQTRKRAFIVCLLCVCKSSTCRLPERTWRGVASPEAPWRNRLTTS